MRSLRKSCEIDVPVEVAYKQWRQFEDFPSFMEDVLEVRRLDDTHIRWRARIGGIEKEWVAEIVERVPDERIAWRSISGTPNSGHVRFQPTDRGSTRVTLCMEFQPESPIEVAGAAMGVLGQVVAKMLKDFRDHLEDRGRETGAWRGGMRRRGEPRRPAE